MSKVRLQPVHLKLIEQNFKILDIDQDGQLTRQEAGLLLRSLGQTLSNRELKTILDDYFPPEASGPEPAPREIPQTGPPKGAATDKGPTSAAPDAKQTTPEASGITFQRFINMFETVYRAPTSTETVVQSLAFFDPQRTGKLSLTTLRAILSSDRGEPLVGSDLEDILRLARDTCGAPSDVGTDASGPTTESPLIDYAQFARKWVSHTRR